MRSGFFTANLGGFIHAVSTTCLGQQSPAEAGESEALTLVCHLRDISRRYEVVFQLDGVGGNLFDHCPQALVRVGAGLSR